MVFAFGERDIGMNHHDDYVITTPVDGVAYKHKKVYLPLQIHYPTPSSRVNFIVLCHLLSGLNQTLICSEKLWIVWCVSSLDKAKGHSS